MSAAVTYMFAGGGTGGHVYPAVAIAQELQRRESNAKIVFVGLVDKIEAKIAAQHNYIFEAIAVTGFRRALSFKNLLTIVKAYRAVNKSKKLIRKHAPVCVVGTGGYVSGPVLYAAASSNVPCIIHEQNSVPGLTTKMLAKKANIVCLTHAETKKFLSPSIRTALTGNPVRRELASVDKDEARKAFGLDKEGPILLVFGGSLGASAINTAIGGMIRKLVENNIQVIWQTGNPEYQQYEELYGSFDGVHIREYLDDMNIAYSAADMVVCRAGATTIAELTYLGKPSVLIPYPYATDNHQLKNARIMMEAGCSILFEEQHLGGLYDAIIQMISDTDQLSEMSKRSKEKSVPDAAEKIVDLIHGMVR